MGEHKIGLTSVYKFIPSYQKKETLHANSPSEMSAMSAETEQKVRKCFVKLMHYLQKSNKLLY